MDPMRGYPPGTGPGIPAVLSRKHKVHDVFGPVVFLSLAAALVASGLAVDGGWKIYRLVTAASVIVLIVVFGAAWKRDSPRIGLLQRLMVLVGWAWIALFCLSLM